MDALTLHTRARSNACHPAPRLRLRAATSTCRPPPPTFTCGRIRSGSISRPTSMWVRTSDASTPSLRSNAPALTPWWPPSTPSMPLSGSRSSSCQSCPRRALPGLQSGRARRVVPRPHPSRLPHSASSSCAPVRRALRKVLRQVRGSLPQAPCRAQVSRLPVRGTGRRAFKIPPLDWARTLSCRRKSNHGSESSLGDDVRCCATLCCHVILFTLPAIVAFYVHYM